MRVVVAVAPEWREPFFADADFSPYTTSFVSLADPIPSDVDVLVTGWGIRVLAAEVLDQLPGLKLVAHTGATVKPFVTDEVWRRGIRVTQAGEGMAPAVGEAALALTLALLHQLPRFDQALRSGASWQESKSAPTRHEIAGSAVGVVGASRTGRHYIRMVRALGGIVSVYDPYLDDRAAAELGVIRTDLDTLLAGSRVVALHAPVLPETRHLLAARELSLLADGATLVNTARSWLVDQDALLAELRTGRIQAALDVFDEEPLPVDHPFRKLENVLLTPHEAAGTREARRRQGALAMAEIGRFAGGEPLHHEVTRESVTRMG